MKKFPTILPKDPENLSLVVPGEVMSGIESFRLKIDGTSCMVLDGNPYCRLNIKLFINKKGQRIEFSEEEILSKIPTGAIECQEPDEKSGHWRHWIPVLITPEHQYIHEGFRNLCESVHSTGESLRNGTYECVGPKIQGNPHQCDSHQWICHNDDKLVVELNGKGYWKDNPYEFFKDYFKSFPWEGLVAYDVHNQPIGKIRRFDFGYEKNPYSGHIGS